MSLVWPNWLNSVIQNWNLPYSRKSEEGHARGRFCAVLKLKTAFHTRASSLFLVGYSLSFRFHWEFSVASRLSYFRCLWNWTAERKMPGLRPFAWETWNFLLIYFPSKHGIYLTGSLTDSGNLLFWLKNFSQWIILDKYNQSVWLCWVD